MSGHIPLVRIGMIQSAEQIRFSCDQPFDLIALNGKKIGRGAAGVTHTVTAAAVTPARLHWAARLAIRETKPHAEAFQAEQKQATSIWRQGLKLPVQGLELSNEEYWVVVEPFTDQAQAQTFCRTYEPVGEAVVVKKIGAASTGRIHCENFDCLDGLRIQPDGADAVIELADVTVGIEFHWQHTRTQKLPGTLEIRLNNNGKLLAINELDVESYLISVNSSEMTKENPVELLKAQTVAARSTILATMGKHHYDEPFHLCADDHCQCYHGMANVSEASERAARETEGENLMSENRVCDARYAKICGGVMEDYEFVWDNRPVAYLRAGIDGQAKISTALREEDKAKAYIDSEPDVWCNTKKYAINSALPYNTRDLFRWRVTYELKELQTLISKKLGEDFGELIDLIPGERGNSGRLVWMDVVGSRKTVRVGKELAIRRILSESHLYSACFYIERDLDETGKIVRFHLIGAGWGHGVGLCQVGATVMAQLGFDYRQILTHYYRNSKLQKLY